MLRSHSASVPRVRSGVLSPSPSRAPVFAPLLPTNMLSRAQKPADLCRGARRGQRVLPCARVPCTSDCSRGWSANGPFKELVSCLQGIRGFLLQTRAAFLGGWPSGPLRAHGEPGPDFPPGHQARGPSEDAGCRCSETAPRPLALAVPSGPQQPPAQVSPEFLWPCSPLPPSRSVFTKRGSQVPSPGHQGQREEVGDRKLCTCSAQPRSSWGW